MGLDSNPPQTAPGGLFCPDSLRHDAQPSLEAVPPVDVVHPLLPLPLPLTGACLSPLTRGLSRGGPCMQHVEAARFFPPP